MSAIELCSQMPLKRISYITGMPRSFIYYNLNRNSIKRKEYKTRTGKNTVDKIIELSSERITYGYRRIWALLRNSGININRKTVYKIMRENNLTLPVHRHVLKDKIKLETANKPDMVAETDITYIPTGAGMTYLICLKDVYSKVWYGYNYNTSCTADDAINAVMDSIIRHFRNTMPNNFTLRTDNGPQFISNKFNKILKHMNIKHEYTEKETPTENGHIESFHNSIKTDYIWINEISNFNEGKIIIENAFHDYNNIRPHSTLDYYSPSEFENKYKNDIDFRKEYKLYLEKLKKSQRNRYIKNKKVMSSVS
jgi:transposase InsO family protein